MFEKILSLIEKYDRIIIHRHKNPDGDALGSQLGLLHTIKDTYPNKEVYAVGDMTPRYAFMATQPMDEIEDELYNVTRFVDTNKSFKFNSLVSSPVLPFVTTNSSPSTSLNLEGMISLPLASIV